MNPRVMRLLTDYFQRTLGAWLLLAMAHVMQLTAFWAAHVERAPLLGVIAASLAYFAAFDSPHAVLRTLPLSRTDIALFRWWASIGAPSLVILLCTSLAWLISGQNGWARPSQHDVTLYGLMTCATLAVLATLPLPVRQLGRGSWGTFGLVWTLLIGAGFYGVPSVALPPFILKAFIALGLGLALAAYVRTWLGRETRLSIPAVSLFNSVKLPHVRALSGWSILLADVARSTALLSIAAIAGTTLTRWLYPVFDGPTPLTWLFVSAITVGSSLLMRRWMKAVRALRMLPIGAHRLTLVLYALLIAPGAIACLLTVTAWHVSPRLGLDVPAYMFIVFLIAPIGLVPWQRQRSVGSATPNTLHEWAALMQQAAWPIWVGSASTFARLPSGVVLPVLAVVAAAFGIFGYYALLAGVRSSDGFERIAVQ